MAKRFSKATVSNEEVKAHMISQGWTEDNLSLLFSIAAGEDEPSSLCLASAEEAQSDIQYARQQIATRRELGTWKYTRGWLV